MYLRAAGPIIRFNGMYRLLLIDGGSAVSLPATNAVDWHKEAPVNSRVLQYNNFDSQSLFVFNRPMRFPRDSFVVGKRLEHSWNCTFRFDPTSRGRHWELRKRTWSRWTQSMLASVHFGVYAVCSQRWRDVAYVTIRIVSLYLWQEYLTRSTAEIRMTYARVFCRQVTMTSVIRLC